MHRYAFDFVNMYVHVCLCFLAVTYKDAHMYDLCLYVWLCVEECVGVYKKAAPGFILF